MARNLSFLRGLEEPMGKLCYPKPLTAVSLTLHPLRLLEFQYLLHPSADTAVKSKDRLPCCHHWHSQSLSPQEPCCLDQTQGRQTPRCWCCCYLLPLHSIEPFTWAGPKSSFSCWGITKNGNLASSFFPAFHYPFHVTHWKNLTRNQLAKDSEKCSL